MKNKKKLGKSNKAVVLQVFISKVEFEKKNTFFHSVKLFPLYVDIEFA